MKTLRPFASIGFALGVTAVAAVGQVSSAQAQQTVTFAPNPAPTIITSAPYTITTSGLYQLGANLNYTPTGAKNEAIITVAANNVTLDLGGHYLSGPVNTPTTMLYGIYADQKNNVTIQNGTVSHCYYGVYMNNSTNNNQTGVNPIVQNLLVNACYAVGIGFYNTSNGQALNNRVTNTAGARSSGQFSGICGIATTTQLSTLVSGNTISNTGAVAGGQRAFGIYGHDQSLVAIGNTIDSVGIVQNVPGTGIEEAVIARGNQISNCDQPLQDQGVYQDNLSANTGRPIPTGGGGDGGGNN